MLPILLLQTNNKVMKLSTMAFSCSFVVLPFISCLQLWEILYILLLIKDKVALVLMEDSHIRQIWQTYFRKLLNEEGYKSIVLGELRHDFDIVGILRLKKFWGRCIR